MSTLLEGYILNVVARLGLALAVPTLIPGEFGYDTDTKTLRIGDGTSVPPRVMTDKSTGSFDLSSITQIKLPGNVLSKNDGTIGGLNLASLNVSNGLISRVSLGTFASTVIASANNSVIVQNGNGAIAGTIDLAINPNFQFIQDGNKGDITVSGSGTVWDMTPGNKGVITINSSGVWNFTTTTGSVHGSAAWGSGGASGTFSWVVPAGVTGARFYCWGPGGGGGGTSISGAGGHGDGGGSGAFCKRWVALTPGETITIVAGAPGMGGAAGNNPGTTGTQSSVARGGTYLLTAAPGAGSAGNGGGAGGGGAAGSLGDMDLPGNSGGVGFEMGNEANSGITRVGGVGGVPPFVPDSSGSIPGNQDAQGSDCPVPGIGGNGTGIYTARGGNGGTGYVMVDY